MTTPTIYDLLNTNTGGRNNFLIDCTFSTMTDEQKIDFCMTILNDELYTYTYLVCEEPTIFPSDIIWQSLYQFIQETYDFYDIQYEIMNQYLESVKITPVITEQIKELILKKQHDTQLVKFLGIWIGYDYELDNIVDKF
jgi:hypothetical protein